MKAASARVLLTGATGGIGQAATEALLSAGAAVLLAGRSPASLATQVRSLERHHTGSTGRLEWHAADLSTPEGVDSLAQAAAAWECNVVVHNAGLPGFGRFENLSATTLQQMLATNLLAPMLLTQALLAHLKRQPHAQVVCVGSALGRIGVPGFAAYCASKFGLRGFAEALRRELADTPVRVQYFGPRSTRTAFNDAAAESFNAATHTAMDTPGAVARALVELIEDEAAERFLGYPERLAVRINAFAPTVLDGSFSIHRKSLPAAQP